MRACNNSDCSVCNNEGVCDLRVIGNLQRELSEEVVTSMTQNVIILHVCNYCLHIVQMKTVRGIGMTSSPKVWPWK